MIKNPLFKIVDIFRRFKSAYSLYNFLNRAKLKHIEYKELGIEKTYFAPVNSLDFKDAKGESPWLDIKESKEELPKKEVFQKLDAKIQEGILNWSDKGYAIIPGFFTSKHVETINEIISGIIIKTKQTGKPMLPKSCLLSSNLKNYEV